MPNVINNAIRTGINKAFAAENVGVRKLVAATDKEIQKAVDAHTVACKVSKKEYMKGNARTSPARAEVNELFAGLAKAGYFSEGTAKVYATAFWVAFETGQPFDRDVHNKKSSKKGPKKNSGPVTETSVDALVKTLKKAIAQARLLEMDELASALIDVAEDHIEINDDTWEDSEE